MGKKTVDMHRLTSFPASVDERILKHMIDTGSEFIMEVTDKTKADIKVCAPFESDPGRHMLKKTIE